MPIGRLHHLIVDCPEPAASARFWSAVLGDPITYRSDDFVVVSASGEASGLAFQRAADVVASTWPDPAVPQQMHLDVMVDDQEAASAEVLALGARRLDGEHVYADPAGHPFCLIRRPAWASPVNQSEQALPAAEQAREATGHVRHAAEQ
ncbi:VOC family protein [Actinoplanes solisilvae]|uniref:VOC family protein n=1 Tax=Actinoplanes solisilvae TaxID=2486853 RepID=UPI0013E31F0A